jgi:hypothetical protein
MLLKKQYAQDGRVSRIDILHTGSGQVQNFSIRLVDAGILGGWITLRGDKLILHAHPETLVYAVLMQPGRYCNQCPTQLPGIEEDPLGVQAREHIATEHPEVPMHLGYVARNYYACALDQGAHEKWRVRPGEHRYQRLRRLHSGTPPIAGSMGNIVANISLGSVAEFYKRIDSNDPANSAFIVALLANAGIEADATLKDKDDFSTLVSGTTDFATNTGATRKTLTDADLAAFAPDDANDRVDLDVPDQTWTAVANDGTGAIAALVFGYDSDTTAGADVNIVFVTKHDFAVTPDGSDITAQIAAAGFFRAS